MDAVLPLVHIEVVLEVLGNVFEILVTAVGSLVSVLCLEDAVFAARKATGEDKLGAEIGSSSAVGESLHLVRLLGMRAISAFGGESEMATLGSADPDDVGSVEVVQMLLKVGLAAELDEVAVQKAHGALVLLESVDMEARRDDGVFLRRRGHPTARRFKPRVPVGWILANVSIVRDTHIGNRVSGRRRSDRCSIRSRPDERRCTMAAQQSRCC